MATTFSECPLPAALTCIPTQSCPIKWGQIQKMAFQRRAGANAFTAATSISQQSMWTSAMAAPGANRIIVSPFINNFVIPNGEVTYDGGNTNETLNGMAFYTGVTPVTVTGFLVNASPEVVKAFRKLAVSSYGVGFSDLEAFMFNERGDIICRNRGTATSPIYRGIPVYQMGIGTVGTAGLGANNQNNISFQLLGNWDEDLITVSTYNAAMPWSPLELENTCA